MKTKRLIFVEDFDESIATYKGDTIIALTPLAMYEFDARGWEYKIPEKYLVWEETPSYTGWFCSWLDSIDDLIFKGCGEWRVGTHCLTMLKNVVDAFTRRYAQMNTIAETEQPDEVLYFVDAGRLGDVEDDELYFKGQSLYLSMARALWWERLQLKVVASEVTSRVEGREAWRDNPILRRVYDYFRCFSFLPTYRGKYFMFASPMPGMMRWLRLHGYRCSLLPVLETLQPRNWPSTYRFDEFYYPLNLVARDILERKVNYFLDVIVPKIVWLKGKYSTIFGQLKFDGIDPLCLIFNRRNRPYQYAALMAVREHGIPTIYARHGWDAYDMWERELTRFKFFDAYLSNTVEDAHFYRGKVKEWGLMTEVI